MDELKERKKIRCLFFYYLFNSNFEQKRKNTMASKRRVYDDDVDDEYDDNDDFSVPGNDHSTMLMDMSPSSPSSSTSSSLSSSSSSLSDRRFSCSTLQLFRLPVVELQHPRESNIRWTAKSLVNLGIHVDMKSWFDKNVVNYIKNRTRWPSRVSPKRFLLNFGRSGSGRLTALVTACAEHSINIITVRGDICTPDYIKTTYTQAKANQPCVIYFENDRRITSNEKDAYVFRKHIYAAYNDFMNVCNDEVWTVVASNNPPQNLINGESTISQFFAVHSDAVYTPVLTSHPVIVSIIENILHSYTKSEVFRRPSEEWTVTIDKLATYAHYHTIKEIYTFINDIFRIFMQSEASSHSSVPKPHVFLERFNDMPGVADLRRLALWRTPTADHKTAEKHWQAYKQTLGPKTSLPQLPPFCSEERSRRRTEERERRNQQRYEETEYVPQSPTSPVYSHSFSPSSPPRPMLTSSQIYQPEQVPVSLSRPPATRTQPSKTHFLRPPPAPNGGILRPPARF